MKNFFRNNAIFGFAEIIGRIPLIFTAGYVARKLGPDVYGNWALVLAFQGILVSVASMGLSSSISRIASAATPELARGYVTVALGITAIPTLLAIVVAVAANGPIGAALGVRGGLTWLLIPGAVLAFAGVAESLIDAYFKARERLVRQGLLVATRSCIEVGSLLAVFNIGGGHSTKLLAIYAGVVILAKLVVYPAFLLAKSPPALAPDRRQRREFLRYGVPLIPSALVMFLTTQGDRLVLGHLVQKGQLGVYAFGASLAAYFVYLSYAVYPLLLPRASVMYDQDRHDEVSELFSRSQLFYLALFSFAIGVVSLFGHEIIRVTAGPAYYGGRDILIILAAGVGIEGLLGIYQWVFHLVKRTGYILWFNVGYMCLNLVIVFVAASLGGVRAAAWGALVVVAFSNAIRYLLARRLYDLRLGRSLVTTSAAAIAGVALLAIAGGRLDLGARLTLGVLLTGVCAVGLRYAAAGSAVPRIGRAVAGTKSGT